MIEVKIPSPGESITEVEIAEWFVKSGDYVDKDQELGEIESDKATLPLIAEESGEIKILMEAGTVVKVGEVVCTINTDKKGKAKTKSSTRPQKINGEGGTSEVMPADSKRISKETDIDKKEEAPEKEDVYPEVKITPVAKKMMEENHLSVDDIIKGLRKIGKNEVNAVRESLSQSIEGTQQQEVTRHEDRNKMSSLRRKLSQRLVSVKNETAMLTTFNEVDMSAILELRKKYQQQFVEKHGIKLGFMSFFTKAVTIALQTYPKVNSMIHGEDIVSPSYVDVGIAVQTEKGLMVPIIRNTETLSLAQIEMKLADLAQKARKNRISIEELTGGTFSITNGGVFGSLLSTPILNPPQSAILGMHNIVERPVAVNGKVEIKPMMYLALSYDHRLIDGKDSVTFLVKVKELIENPYKMLLGGKSEEELLLGI